YSPESPNACWPWPPGSGTTGPPASPANDHSPPTTTDQQLHGIIHLGAPIEDEFGRFGEPTDPKQIAAALDEGLDALALLWSGEPVDYRGEHVLLDDVLCLPTPLQRPRIPIWVAGRWPNKPPMRRAARWDGVIPLLPGTETGQVPSPADVTRLVNYIADHRAEANVHDQPFDVVIGGTTTPTTAAVEHVARVADAGATWWDEQRPFDDHVGELDPVLRRIEQGPPRITV
ncbi:MAG: LLM class flavin-dependent oxidoreductase, partial [Streptosporangiales bacterium]|nr:LLM class flavin-dependent oxidoreductase [Streptosporangiales bacterium]